MAAPRRLCTTILTTLLVAACSGPSADEHFKKAQALEKQSSLTEAILEYRLAVQADAKRGDIRLKLAEAYLRNNDPGRAFKESIYAADLLPNDPVAQIRAGDMLLAARQFEDAKSRAQKALAVNPKNVEAQVLLGNALAGLKNFAGALDEFQAAAALNPTGDSAYINIGAVEAARGHKAEAEAAFKKAIDIAPKSLQARMGLANFYWSTGRLPEAEQALKDALAIDPSSMNTARALGTFYMSTNRQAEAEPYFQSLVTVNPTTEAKLGLADYYLATKRPDDATKILRDLASKPDGFAPATTRLASIEFGRGNRAQALSLVEDVLNKKPRDMQARLLKTRVLFAGGKADDALKVATSIVTDDASVAQAADAYMIIGSVQSSMGRPEEAARAYEEVLKRKAQPVGALMALAAINFANGAYDKTLTYCQQTLTLVPDNPQARTMIARVHLATNEKARATDEINALIKDYPKSASPLNLLGAQQFAEGRFEDARKSFAKAAQLAPNDIEAMTGLITVDLATKHAPEAVGRLEAVLKTVEPTGEFLILAGKTYSAAGNPAKAEEMLKRAIDVEPNGLIAYSLLGQLYASQQRRDDARDQFQHIVDQNPKAVGAITMLGLLFESQNRLDKAEKQYQQALAVDPKAAVAANNLAGIYLAQNRNLDQALELAQSAIGVLPNEPHVNDTLGWIYYKKSMIDKAVRQLENSIKHGPDDAEVHYHLGMAYLLAGDADLSKKSLQRAVASKVNFPGIDEARATLAKLGGD